MKPKAKKIKTPLGFFPAPLNPGFKKQIESFTSNEELFQIVEVNGFINPDAFNEIIARDLYPEYIKFKNNKINGRKTV
jgi:hypothetical protein